MPTIEYLEKRIAGRQKEIEKLTKKISRIEKAKATGWEDNPYYYSESDLRWANRDLEDAKAALEKYQQQLKMEQEKAASRNVTAILEFLNRWKAHVMEYYGEGLKALHAERKSIRKLEEEARGNDELRKEVDRRQKAYREKIRGKFERQEYEIWGRKRTQTVKVAPGEWEHLAPYVKATFEEGMDILRAELDKEAARKYDDIINRVTAITGTITDASQLTVGAKGELNGYVYGERGCVRVHTIGAGGYNIQCFHYRTIVTKA